MPFPPDHDTTDPDDAAHSTSSPRTDGPSAPAGSPEERSAGWARLARTGSAATAVAALAAIGGGSMAQAAPPQTPQVASAPVLIGQQGPEVPEHTVSRGDSLWAIAQRHGVEVADLMRWNDLSGAAVLHPDQKLRLAGAEKTERPGEAPAPEEPGPAPEPAPEDYVVRPGDSLWSIAQAHEVSVQELLEANDLTVGSLLRPGQELAVGGPTLRPASAAEPEPVPEPAAPPEPEPATEPRPERAVGDTFLGRTYEDAVVDSANRHHAELASRPVPSREQMRQMVRDTAERMGVDPALALAHAHQESGFDHRAVSPADAVGTMQVIPDAGAWASAMVGRELDLIDPQDNVTAGVAIIGRLARSAENTDEAIAAYYQGLHGVQKYGMYEDTKRYVKKVKAHRESFSR
ncbi:LysM peptidoglycan-binding domain-containing protein [Kocuria sp. M1R5S2]|uniref:LysM peptidoglycan-binding domain-containing protein n=1 Tax=Kocuria rhizosphaerae TaxID=3376285 RepID=UPI0037A41DA1